MPVFGFVVKEGRGQRLGIEIFEGEDVFDWDGEVCGDFMGNEQGWLGFSEFEGGKCLAGDSECL